MAGADMARRHAEKVRKGLDVPLALAALKKEASKREASEQAKDVDHRTVAELLRMTLRALNMKQVDLNRRTGLSAKHINQLAQGNVSLTPDVALLLERATGLLAERWMAAELNRRRIQDGQVALRSQLTCAAVHALRSAGREGDSVTAAVALMAMERLLEQLGIPVWDGVMSPHAHDCGPATNGETTPE